MHTQRHLLTSNLAVIEQLTGLPPGLVNTEDPAFRRAPWQAGYWLSCDYRLTGSWVLETVLVPVDRRLPMVTHRREIPADMVEVILRLVALA